MKEWLTTQSTGRAGPRGGVIVKSLAARRLSGCEIIGTVFHPEKTELVGRPWFKDPVETIVRSESRKRAPWSGYWFVSVAEGPHRNWDENRRYGYIGAGRKIFPPS